MKSDEFLWKHLDWNLMRVFHEIVQRGGVSAAARSLGRHQPATSQALSRLEDQLGVTLCERGPSGFSVTPEGEIVFRIATEMVELMRQAPDLLSQAVGAIRGRLRICAMSSIASPDFDEMLTSIARRQPYLEISIDLATWENVLNAVRTGDADVGLAYMQVVDQTLTYQPVFHEVQQIYCGTLHPLYGQRFSDPSKLSDEMFFLAGRDEPFELLNFRRQFGLGKRSRGGSENIAEMKRLILTGSAIGFLPSLFVEDDVRKRELWPLLSYNPLPRYAVNLMMQPQAVRSLPAQLLWDEARRRINAQCQ